MIIKSSVQTLFQSLTNPETIQAYKRFGRINWRILRHIMILLWLIGCWFIVGIGWVISNGRNAILGYRTWYQTVADKPEGNLILEGYLALWEWTKYRAAQLHSFAQQQLKGQVQAVQPVSISPSQQGNGGATGLVAPAASIETIERIQFTAPLH